MLIQNSTVCLVLKDEFTNLTILQSDLGFCFVPAIKKKTSLFIIFSILTIHSILLNSLQVLYFCF